MNVTGIRKCFWTVGGRRNYRSLRCQFASIDFKVSPTRATLCKTLGLDRFPPVLLRRTLKLGIVLVVLAVMISHVFLRSRDMGTKMTAKAVGKNWQVRNRWVFRL